MEKSQLKLEIDKKLHQNFKVAAVRSEVSMASVVVPAIEGFVSKYKVVDEWLYELDCLGALASIKDLERMLDKAPKSEFIDEEIALIKQQIKEQGELADFGKDA